MELNKTIEFIQEVIKFAILKKISTRNNYTVMVRVGGVESVVYLLMSNEMKAPL